MFFKTTTIIAFLPTFLGVNMLLLVPYNNFFHSKPVWKIFFYEITQIPHSTTPWKKKSKVSSNSVWISLCNVCMTMIMVVWRVQWSFIKKKRVSLMLWKGSWVLQLTECIWWCIVEAWQAIWYTTAITLYYLECRIYSVH